MKALLTSILTGLFIFLVHFSIAEYADLDRLMYGFLYGFIASHRYSDDYAILIYPLLVYIYILFAKSSYGRFDSHLKALGIVVVTYFFSRIPDLLGRVFISDFSWQVLLMSLLVAPLIVEAEKMFRILVEIDYKFKFILNLVRTLFYGSTHFYLLAFLVSKYSIRINSLFIALPAIVSVLSLLVLIAFCAFRRTSLKGAVLALSYFIFSVSFSVFALKYLPE